MDKPDKTSRAPQVRAFDTQLARLLGDPRKPKSAPAKFLRRGRGRVLDAPGLGNLENHGYFTGNLGATLAENLGTP